MKKMDTSIQKRLFKATTDSRHSLPVADNLLAQRFETEAPGQAWVTDITYSHGQGLAVSCRTQRHVHPDDSRVRYGTEDVRNLYIQSPPPKIPPSLLITLSGFTRPNLALECFCNPLDYSCIHGIPRIPVSDKMSQ